MARINSSGEISVPLLGYVNIEGKTLLELEEYLTRLYHPKFLKEPPTIVASVQSYYTVPVTVMGGVNSPGTYELRRQELSLVYLLSRAGGIGGRTDAGEETPGARAVRIRRAIQDTGNENPQSRIDEEVIILPVEGVDIDFVDVALKPGDVVEVERMDPRTISVIGLVRAPGVFPYSPRRHYAILDAIALAGGLNDIADPKYATVYRMDQSGQLVAYRFRISGWGKVKQDAATLLKPGDVVAVEQTVETSLRVLMAQIVRVGFNVGDSFGFSGD
jgi:protein involved in polysaccharide export with SLBB domain